MKWVKFCTIGFLSCFNFIFASWIQFHTNEAFSNHGITPPENTVESGVYYFWNTEKREIISIRPTSIGGNNNLYLNYTYSILNSSGGESLLLGQSVTNPSSPHGFSIVSNPSGSLQIGGAGNNGRGANTIFFIYISIDGSKYANNDAQGTSGYLPLSAGNIHQIETGRRNVGGNGRSSGWVELTYSWIRTTPVTTIKTPTSTPQASEIIAAIPPEIEAILNPPEMAVPRGALTISRSRVRGGSTVLVEGRVD